MRGGLRYTDDEFAAIRSVAASAGMKPGAWAQQAAYRAAMAELNGDRAVRDLQADVLLLEELRQQRRVLANIGGNLNDLARVANSTGQLGDVRAVAVVLRLVSNTVRSCAEVIDRVRAGLPR